MTRTNICFPLRAIQRIARYKEMSGLSMGEIVRRAVDEWLLKQGY